MQIFQLVIQNISLLIMYVSLFYHLGAFPELGKLWRHILHIYYARGEPFYYMLSLFDS